MANNYGCQDVLCPYYRRHDGFRIDCEGYFEGSLNRQIFRRRMDAEEHLKQCQSDWENCPIAKMLNEKWGV